MLDLAAEAITRGLNITDPDSPDSGAGEDTATWGIFPLDDHHDAEKRTHSNTSDSPGGSTGTEAHHGTGDGDGESTATDAQHGTGDGDGDGDESHGGGQSDGDESHGEGQSDGESESESESAADGADAAGDEPTGPHPAPGAPQRPPDPSGGPPGWTRADLEGGDRVALTLTLNYDALRAALTTIDSDAPTHADVGYTGHLGLLGENTWIRPETARRLACDAELIPLVLGSGSEVLDLGRKKRIANPALRRAVTHRDRHCAHPGCRRRARRCQVHHILHWIDGGESNPDNCVLLCGYHHTLIHHSGWDVHMIDGLPWFTPPTYIDPAQRPRHNRPWTLVAVPPAP
ncbi:HNH endonuclease [Actinomycetospora endophytica]|uniref:HNH endonuclease n=2 Tax=Actinomycetospora endophytica TaxID=2291215 RepID=A0ABS8P971_9PSEU|nr:HNH endonuclease [Actinomycetospora endophytica]